MGLAAALTLPLGHEPPQAIKQKSIMQSATHTNTVVLQEAKSCGLVLDVVEPDQLMAAATDLAKRIAGKYAHWGGGLRGLVGGGVGPAWLTYFSCRLHIGLPYLGGLTIAMLPHGGGYGGGACACS